MGWRHDNDYIYLPSFFNQILQEKEYNFLFAAESAGLNSITHDSELAIIQRTFFFQWFQVNKLMVFYDWLLCPAPNRRGIKQCFCLTSVCLSRTSGLSREQRPRKTKIGTEVAHVTRDSDTTIKVKMLKVKITGLLWLVVLSGQHGHTVMVTYPWICVLTYIMNLQAGRGHIVAAACQAAIACSPVAAVLNYYC